MTAVLLTAVLGLAGAAFASEGKVWTRGYGRGAPAVTDGRVVTRGLSEVVLPSAGTSPLALSFVPGASLPPEDWSVVGLRVDLLAGRHRDLWGVDIGVLGNELTGTLTGLQGAGLWNRVGEAPAAVQSAGLANLCERDFCGVQAAGIYNWTGEEFTGVQVGLINRAGNMVGLQTGLFNSAGHGAGVQIGLVNIARALEGVQIGLANVNAQSTLEFFPILNMAF